MAHLYIIRGLPGSGKSTLAKRLLQHKVVAAHYEADMFFESKGLAFNKELLSSAHKWCMTNVFMDLGDVGDEYSINVVVSNTFTTMWEMQPYINYCKENGHSFSVITCEGDYGNVHGVPDDTIEKMRKRWEPYNG